MPENAVVSGFVDFVLSPEKIGIEMARIARHPGLQQRLAPIEQETGTEERGRCEPRTLRLLSARNISLIEIGWQQDAIRDGLWVRRLTLFWLRLLWSL